MTAARTYLTRRTHAQSESRQNDGWAVQLSGVDFSYEGMPVLRGVDLAVAPGSFTILAGANGAGKSTLLKLVLGELQPSAGTIRVLGADPFGRRFNGRVGYVPQQAPGDYARFPASVFETVRAGLYADAGAILPYRRRHRERTMQALEQAGLDSLGKRLIGELSGGQFQRMLLARAIVSRPELLVLDEPTANLDDASAQTLVETVAHAAHSLQAAVLLVSHDLDRLPALHDRVIVLANGALSERVEPPSSSPTHDCHPPQCSTTLEEEGGR